MDKTYENMYLTLFHHVTGHIAELDALKGQVTALLWEIHRLSEGLKEAQREVEGIYLDR